MHFSFLHPFKMDLKDEHRLAAVHEAPHSTSEGSEFLDDGLRMEDLPWTPIEECVAAGSPDHLL